MPTKAVVFTHVRVTPEAAKQTGTQEGAQALIERVVPCFKNLLMCRNVGLVYVYEDVGTELTLEILGGSRRRINFPLEELEREERTRNCLKLAVDRATEDLLNDPSYKFDRALAPRFQVVGLPHLLGLFYKLWIIDPRLLAGIAGELSKFTYDSPKFVEAVIRLVRGAIPIHAQHPIFRFDADVEVTEDGVAALLSAVAAAMVVQSGTCDFFSGSYGSRHGQPEPVNDYAVRCHWLAPEHPASVGPRGLATDLVHGGTKFLRDLGEIGATQVDSSLDMSDAMKELVRQVRGGSSGNRATPQVVSGAGLYITRSAIELLPPFMNSTHLIVWVDDHLKRRLHETLGHLSANSRERVDQAHFQQEREHFCACPESVKWAEDFYFERVLRGCILHALIEAPDRRPGELSKRISEIMESPLQHVDAAALSNTLLPIARGAGRAVLEVWAKADYGNRTLQDWAARQIANVNVLADSTVADAVAYARLVQKWPLYVRAISALTPVHAYWLFRRVN